MICREQVPPEKIAQFRAIRPMIETGYEAILAMRLLYLEEPPAALARDFANKSQTLTQAAQVSVDDLKHLFGVTRDRWIANDLADWISMNPLFDSIAETLYGLGPASDWYVVTTKQERFVQQILQANAITLPSERIFGLDRNMSKVEVLTGLLQTHPDASLHFVEDRLPTLLNVLKTDGLKTVKLYFALWGYNTAEDKVNAAKYPIMSLELDKFLGIF